MFHTQPLLCLYGNLIRYMQHEAFVLSVQLLRGEADQADVEVFAGMAASVPGTVS